MNPQLIQQFLAAEALPATYLEDASRWFLPLANELWERLAVSKDTLLIGINGAQGTGKSTLASLLATLLGDRGASVAVLSIDDFYLSRARRTRLAQRQHPLLATRGVPGTHDTDLLDATLQALSRAGADDSVVLPRFDKARDDCVERESWPLQRGPVDLVLLEGWFIGVEPETDPSLHPPLNELEQRQDPDGAWRRFVNAALAGPYQEVFRQLDLLIMLQAPGFEQVYAWRKLQEDKLREKQGSHAPGLMNDASLRRFIQHFERLTRHCLRALPRQADIVFRLTEDHRVVARQDRKPAPNQA